MWGLPKEQGFSRIRWRSVTVKDVTQSWERVIYLAKMCQLNLWQEFLLKVHNGEWLFAHSTIWQGKTAMLYLSTFSNRLDNGADWSIPVLMLKVVFQGNFFRFCWHLPISHASIRLGALSVRNRSENASWVGDSRIEAASWELPELVEGPVEGGAFSR